MTQQKTCTKTNFASGEGVAHAVTISCEVSCPTGYSITSCFSKPSVISYPNYVSVSGNTCTAFVSGYDQISFSVTGTIICGKVQ